MFAKTSPVGVAVLLLASCLASENAQDKKTVEEQATLGGGCFWCTEAVFLELRGVIRVESGYTGGKTVNPTYKDICTGTTGHAEVVRVTYDPKKISFADILEVFFVTHDPTTRNRQGPDSGTQYRSAIFYHSPAQKKVAEEMIARLTKAKAFAKPIVTEVTEAAKFYKAEDYHQAYYANNPNAGYCEVNIAPKLQKLREKFAEKVKK
jgi:peptide-methionine (S)-S-oxide reductase